MIKKQIAILSILILTLSLSSCGLFKCKHKEYDVKTVAPNCFSEGYTEHTCKKCGESYKDNYLPETKHHFAGAACPNCGKEEITENITPDTEWHNEEAAMFSLTTKEQLAGFASLVNSGTDFANKIVYLAADIDLGYYEWIPIGNAEHAYNGKFDGDGHTISGLKINANHDYVGFFGNAIGVITNFSIEDANIFAARDYKYVSIICGYTTNEMTDVSAGGFIEAPKSDYVGAIAGASKPGDVLYSKLTNTATVKGKNFVGGVIGDITSTGIVQTDRIKNTGDVTGTSQVGGIFGHISANVGSSVYNASSSANIVGDYYVGGIVGKADNVGVSTCKNDGSTVTANSYYTEGSEFRAWLGGFVGCGYSVDHCTNNSDITYDSRGSYVGGIIGYATNNVYDCTNNGSITTYTNYVGGIAGELNSTVYSIDYKNLSNNANVSGKDYVGGIAGKAYKKIQIDGDRTCEIKQLSNSASVSGENCVGGIMGAVHYENTYWLDRKCSLNVTSLINTGDVLGKNTCGELFGSFSSDGASTVTNYTVNGKITINGELLEGEYDVGSNTNLTLSGREIYGAENTEETE